MASDKAQQALNQLKQAAAANPEAAQQAVTDAIASLRETVTNLTAQQKAEAIVALRQLETRVSEARLKLQVAELIRQLDQAA
jgi:hypothetical protein